MTDWEMPVALLVLGSISLYAYLATNWKVRFFKGGENYKGGIKAEESPTLLKVLIQLTCVWLVPLLLQLASEIGEANTAPADVITLIEAVYTVGIWIGITVSSYVVIATLIALLTYLGVDIVKSKLGEKR